ncbi:MAG: hypothetical protein IT307_14965 [Chloroflexi bacterium]|nr:hypothetical protein [Chloroflexota bacterium]
MGRVKSRARDSGRRHGASPRLILLVGLATVAAGLAFRLWLLHGPYGEVEADESVVGLMGLHILQGERPVFYWGQPYLGSLEAYLVAAVFAAVGPSNLALKLVPTVAFLAFLALSFLGARRDLGSQPAALTAIWYALPPSFLAFWSVKARGGYVELLLLGQALIFLAPWAVAGRWLAARLFLYGAIAGVIVWTHLLGLAWAVPALGYVAGRLGLRRLRGAMLACLVGVLLGLSPAIVENLTRGGATLAALGAEQTTLEVVQDNFRQLVDVGLPVMAGLGQATSSPVLFEQDWPRRPGSWPWSGAVLLGLGAVLLAPWAIALTAPFRGPRGASLATPYFGVLVPALTVVLASLGRFGELVAEPRYALGLYVVAPLVFASLWRLRATYPLLLGGCLTVIFGLSAYSLATADPRLNLPTTAGTSREASRAQLVAFLERAKVAAIYTDYWLAYPVIFESRERIVAAVVSGGYDRLAAYPHLVSIDPSPAAVFAADTEPDARFAEKLSAAASAAHVEEVAGFRIYRDTSNLEPLRAR